MRTRFPAIALSMLSLAAPCAAHRLDEYLQATTISVEQDRIVVEMRLSPGVEVAPFLLRGIDHNGDGIISATEETAYANLVGEQVTLRQDGIILPLQLDAKTFAGIFAMQEGRGQMQLRFVARPPATKTADHQLQFENVHLRPISVYLVNALVSSDPQIRLGAQTRNYEQSSYHLDYAQSPATTYRWWLIAIALLWIARFAFMRRTQDNSMLENATCTESRHSF